MQSKNWLHLDLKGAVPSFGKLLEQLQFFKACGYTGIVWEYDDRIPWQCWPGTWRKGFTSEEHAELILRSRELGLENVPLIQTMGHMDWLLRHDEYRHLSENGVISELCPLHPEVLPKLEAWIDEVIALHPGIQYIHLGADETFYMGSCEKCRTHEKMELYIEHVSKLCRYVLSKKIKPLIWADMFWRESRSDLAARLPEGTILVEWQYVGAPPYGTLTALEHCGHELMGASGVMVGWWEQCYLVQGIPSDRLTNVIGWNSWTEGKHMGMIHTTWTRASSMWNLYGPWIGYLPVFIAGGNPAAWEKHPWHDFMVEVSEIMRRDQFVELNKAAERVLEFPACGEFEKESRRWWNLALRYQAIQKEFKIHRETRSILEKTVPFVGKDNTMFEKHAVEPFGRMGELVLQWEKEVRSFWHDNELSDEEEFISSRCNSIIEICEKLSGKI